MTLDLLHEEEYEALRKKLREEPDLKPIEQEITTGNAWTDYRIKSFNAILTTLSIAAVIIFLALIVLVQI